MYTLYYLPGACSMAVHAVLNELGQAVKLENVSVPRGQPRTPEFLKINPRGNVPVLIDDGQSIREAGAILTYLLDKHESPMLPKSGFPRAVALEWLAFANATLHPAYSRVFFILKTLTDPAGKEEALTAAIESINKLWVDVHGRLDKAQYVCGSECTSADILIAVIANWSPMFPKPIVLGKNVKRLLADVSARPSFQQALKTEGVQYKVLS
jgi:glutathione S-transferase